MKVNFIINYAQVNLSMFENEKDEGEDIL